MIDAKSILSEFRKDLFGKTGRQASVLYSSQIAALLLGLVTRIISTRALGPEGYGILAFFISITTFTVLFFRFGLFSAGTLLIAESKSEREGRELAGSLILVTFIAGVAYSLFVLIFSFFIDDIFNTEIGWILRYCSVLVIILPFTYLIYSVGTGMNKIERMSLFNIIPRLTYVLGALVLLKMLEISPFHFVLLHIASIIVGVLFTVNLFHPLFTQMRKNLHSIWQKTKDYGRHVYFGEIANQTTYHLDGIFITYFVNTTQLGFYSLATAITTPMVALSRSLLITLFKDFTRLTRIPRKVIVYNFLWLAACVAGLAIFGKFIVVLLFTEKFLPAVRLIPPLAVAAFFQGMYQPYGFLAAKGKGKWIRNVAHTEAVCNVIGNIFLIYFFGAYGAAVASAISKFIHWVMLRHYYHRFIKGDTTTSQDDTQIDS